LSAVGTRGAGRPWPAWATQALLACGCLALAVLSVHGMEGYLRPEKGADLVLQKTQGEDRVPSTLRAVAYLAGFKIPASHLFWIETLQYYGDHVNAKERYKRLYEFCRLTTDLNPHFLKPYEFGASILGFQVGRPEEAVELLRRGIELNPKAHSLKLLLAAIGYQSSDRYQETLPLLEALAHSGEAPPVMLNILANTYLKAGRDRDAERLWRWILANAKDRERRELATRGLKTLYSERRSGSVPKKGKGR